MMVQLPGRPVANDQKRPIGELFGHLATDTGTLLRQEAKLVTKELGAKVAHAGNQVFWIAGGLLLGAVALLILLMALVAGLSEVMEPWLASLMVGLPVAATAVAITMKSLKALHDVEPKLEQAINALEDTKTWAKEQVR